MTIGEIKSGLSALAKQFNSSSEESKLILGAVEALEQEPCDTCEHSDEIDGSNCYGCVKGIRDRYNPQPCNDTISRQAVLDLPRIKTRNEWGKVIHESVDVENVRQLPSVTPQPKTGYWIEVDTNMFGCSNCSHCFSIVPEDNSIKQYHYCPRCGHPMVEPQESEV